MLHGWETNTCNTTLNHLQQQVFVREVEKIDKTRSNVLLTLWLVSDLAGIFLFHHYYTSFNRREESFRFQLCSNQLRTTWNSLHAKNTLTIWLAYHSNCSNIHLANLETYLSVHMRFQQWYAAVKKISLACCTGEFPHLNSIQQLPTLGDY